MSMIWNQDPSTLPQGVSAETQTKVMDLVQQGVSLRIFGIDVGKVSLNLGRNITLEVDPSGVVTLTAQATPSAPFDFEQMTLKVLVSSTVQMVRFSMSTSLTRLIERIFGGRPRSKPS